MLEWGNYLLENTGDLPLPLYITHGSADGLTSYQASQQFVSKSAGNIHSKWWEGLYHEIHNEAEQNQLFEDILKWLNACLKL